MDITGNPNTIPTIPKRRPPTITVNKTSSGDKPTEFPTTCG